MAFSAFDDLTTNTSHKMVTQALAAAGAEREITEVIRLLVDLQVDGHCDGVDSGSSTDDILIDLRFYLQERQDKLRAFLHQKPGQGIRL